MTPTETQAPALSIRKEARRHYIDGPTYPVRATLKEAGAKWDPDQSAWWFGSAEKAKTAMDRITQQRASQPPPLPPPDPSEERIALRGNTYPVRDQLKDLGATWDAPNKQYLVPASRIDAAQKLVASAPKQEFRHTRCKECGALSDRYRRIYRNGVCSDCYRDSREEAEMGW
ncbi:MAG: hypothetical protein HC888_12245 [Candidatus Competibacteraceae bacterium]|nr:hypothetical protein [Candidatus Competibacteraceae bacterium]